MDITEKEVEYVSKLARLELKPEENKIFAKQLGCILEYISQLNKLDTSLVPPTSHTLNLKNVWREDIVKPCSEDVRNSILNNAPEREDNYFKVKKVIE